LYSAFYQLLGVGLFGWSTLQLDFPAIEFSIEVGERQCSIVPTITHIGHMMAVWVLKEQARVWENC
jgi:hypothetical protein